MVIGNDCPALTTTHLLRAVNQLHSAPVVLGPDRRGGLYLLGLTRAVFEQLSLPSLPWQTDRLYQAVCRVCAGEPVTCLPRLGDNHTRSDLRQYRAATPFVALFVGYLLRLGTSQLPVFGPARFVRLADTAVGMGLLRAPPTVSPVAIAA